MSRTAKRILYWFLVIVAWTVAIGLLFWSDYGREKRDIRNLALQKARETYKRDCALRLWMTSYGAVYVPGDIDGPDYSLSKNIPDREIQTSTGATFTRVIPHQVIRLVQKDFPQLYETKSRLTSLTPSSLDTAPDPWEKAALQRLITPNSEVSEFTDMKGEPFLRLMKPLITTRKCLLCHSGQGYKEGSIHGGIAITLPMGEFVQQGHRSLMASIKSYTAIYLLGFVGIVVGMRRLERRQSEVDIAVRNLRHANEELETRVAERTAELRESNSALHLEILQRENAQEALQRSEERYRRLVISAPLGIISINREGRITEANPIFLKILNPIVWDIQPSVDLYSLQPIVDSGMAGDFLKCLESSESLVTERVLTSRSGELVALRLHLAPVHDGKERMLGAQAVVEDITESYFANEALRMSEQRFWSFFESTTDFTLVLDMDGRISQANPAITEALGYTVEELKGLTIQTLLSPEAMESFPIEMQRLTERGQHRYETELVSKNGSIFLVDCSGSAVRDPSGTIASFVLLHRDVTNRKRAEQQIENQNEFLNAVLESLTHPFYVIDAKTYQVVLANRAAGLTFLPGESTCHSLTHGLAEPCNSNEHICPAVAVKHTKAPATVEHIHYDQNGDSRVVEVHMYPILDSDGNVVQLIEYSLDVTERKRAEEKLKESEERMRLVIESSPVGIAVIQDGRCRYANPATVRMLGYDDRDELAEQSLSFMFAPKDREVVLAAAQDIIEGRTSSQSFELQGFRKDDTEFETTVWLIGIRHQEAPGVLLFVMDVSQERKLRSQLLQAQKMDAIGTLASGIAHDFNNLLQAIHGYAELALMKSKEGEPGHKAFQVIISAARRAGELTKGLLTFSRQVESERKPVDLNQEVKEITKLLARTIPKTIRTELKLAPNLRITNADPSQLQQVVINLAVNARDAMPEGGKLTIETRNIVLDSRHAAAFPQAQEGEYVTLSVSDTGHGMKKATIERIFEPFFSTKERGRGTGLGLSMVYGIIKNHGGFIRCYSEPEIGTTFTMYLPVQEPVDETLSTAPEESIVGGTETILVVDDEEPLRSLAREILTTFGYTVLTADNGLEGLRIFQNAKDSISLVMLDLMMPDLNGWECTEKILAVNPKAKVIVVSGYASEKQNEDAVQRGAKRFLRKPYEAKALLNIVRSVLDDASLENE